MDDNMIQPRIFVHDFEHDKHDGHVDHLSCDAEHKTDVGILSHLCVNGSYDQNLCIYHLDEQRPYRIALGIWALIVMMLGVFGNLITLLAIPYAAKRQR